MKIDFWNLMIIKDDWILKIVDCFFKLKELFNLKLQYRVMTSNRIIRHIEKRDKLFIILNGPSLQKQDLSKLKNQDLVFVNRGFLHPLYKELAPKFHVFVDSKMLNGTWDINWLNEIKELVPHIIFVLPARWFAHPLLQPFIQKKFPIIWIKGNVVRGTGVSDACFSLGLKINYKKIYFTGFDANGFANDLLKKSSHFYGTIDDGELQSAEDYMKGYYMNCRQFRELILISKKVKKKNVEIINLTDGGLLDMFPREDFNSVL